ncbi:MAG: hypothetical protein JXR96_19290 [Deltaproteobacteria bacterium]|nr:hypothetical protein [Deltaproteobacteria bacterium]
MKTKRSRISILPLLSSALLALAACSAGTAGSGDAGEDAVADAGDGADADLPDGSGDVDVPDGAGDAGDPGGDEEPFGDNPPEPDLPADDLAAGPPPAGAGTCSAQGLDELCRRRDLAPAKDIQASIDPDGWAQPETLIFRDTQTGVEIVRLTDDPAGSIHHCHINRTPFNADGSYVFFGSSRCWPGVWCGDHYYFLTGFGARGPRLIDPGAQLRLWVGPFAAWDPEDAQALYFVRHEDLSGLYRIDVDDGRFTTSLVRTLPHPERRKHIFANVGHAGTLAIKTTNTDGEPVFVYVFHPDRPTELTTFDLGIQADHPDHDPAEEWHVHDFTLRRNPEDTIVLNYGPQGDVGEPLFFELSSDGSRAWRISYAPNEDTHCPVPYYSHPAWMHDGTRVVFNGTAEKLVDGTNPDGSDRWVWNDSEWGGYVHRVSDFEPSGGYATSELAAKVAPLDFRISHYAWDGFDARWIHGAAATSEAGAPLYRLRADGGLSELLARTMARSRCSDDCDYCSLPRPAQSPDATKVAYSSDMLQAEANHQDLYAAVHRYPFSPVWLGLVSDSEIRLGWQLHELGREIRSVRIWRSPDSEPFDFQPLGEAGPSASYLDSSAQLADGESVIYAATCVEHSGLESRSLSRVLRVTRIGARYRCDRVEPYGHRGFDTRPPGAPTALEALAEQGLIRLRWSAPGDADLRAFHVYASPDGPPEPVQAFRVASPAAGHPTYLDWSAGPAASSVHYAVTAVDGQGHESQPARVSFEP